MGVDVIHIRSHQPGPRQRRRHAAERAVAIFGRGGDVMGIARHAIAQNLGINPCPARLRMLQRLQHHHPRPFAHHKAIAVGIIGAAGLGRIIGALGRQRLAGVEPGNPDL